MLTNLSRSFSVSTFGSKVLRYADNPLRSRIDYSHYATYNAALECSLYDELNQEAKFLECTIWTFWKAIEMVNSGEKYNEANQKMSRWSSRWSFVSKSNIKSSASPGSAELNRKYTSFDFWLFKGLISSK